MSRNELPPKIKEARDAMRKEFALEAMKLIMAECVKYEATDLKYVADCAVDLADLMIARLTKE